MASVKVELRMWSCGKLLEEKSLDHLAPVGELRQGGPKLPWGQWESGKGSVSLSKPPPQH